MINSPGGRFDHRPPVVLRPVDLQRRRRRDFGDSLNGDQHHVGGVDVAGEHPLFEGEGHGSLAKLQNCVFFYPIVTLV